MEERKLGVVETRFAEIIWRSAPIPSGALVELCRQELGWKKSTTYTVLRKLCQQGLFRNQDGVVSVVVSREEYEAVQSEQFVEETFHGSLPAFVAAFSRRRPLTPQQIAQLRALIDGFEEDAP